jgi:hypothetical protein
MNPKANIGALVLLVAVSIGHGQSQDRWIDPRSTVLPFSTVSPLAKLGDGSLLIVDGNATRTSKDDGKTWSPPQKIYDGPAPGIPCEACVLVRTQAGTLVLVYMDMSTYKWAWDAAKGEAADDVRLDVWSIRSRDDGKTWTDRQKLLDGYCGALIDMIQTKGGRIVVPVQLLLRDRTRHATRSYVSADDGKTWRRGNVLDLGGYGDHDGAMEATLAELGDGRLMMLLRTNLDRFWEAYSDDQGLYWRTLRPSPIDASSAPGYLIRLASGRLALVWNRLYPEGKSTVARHGGGSLSETQASWHRDELALAFSSDDGKTWTKPAVIARQRGGGLSYPYIFERRPGELWVITRFSVNLCLKVREADFLGK